MIKNPETTFDTLEEAMQYEITYAREQAASARAKAAAARKAVAEYQRYIDNLERVVALKLRYIADWQI